MGPFGPAAPLQGIPGALRMRPLRGLPLAASSRGAVGPIPPLMARAWLAIAGLFLLLAGGPAQAEVWRWDDGRGVHFTDSLERVPPAHRADAREITGVLESRGSVVVPGLNDAEGVKPGADPMEDPDATEAAMKREAEAALQQMMDEHGGEMLGTFVGAGLGMLIGFAVLFLPIGLALHALYLMAACRLASDERPGFGRAFLVCGVRFVASVVAGIVGAVATCAVGSPAALDTPGVDLLAFLLSTAVNASLLASLLALSLGRAALVLLTEWLLILASVLLPVLAVFALSAPNG